MGVCLDGLPFFFIFLIVALSVFAWKGFWVASPFAILTLWCLWFFRDPDRTPQITSESAIISPADGTIIQVQEAEYPYLLQGKALRVSIFMSVFNVHVNRIPIDGVIEDTQYHAGKFFSAYVDKASLDNEQMGIVVKTPKTKIMFVQIAGLIARRIICRVGKGEQVSQGQRFGLIRFGSRVDVYLPTNIRLNVKKGDKVNAGKTLIGELS